MKSLSRVWLYATPWTAAHQAPPSMGFSRQEYWSKCLHLNSKSMWPKCACAEHRFPSLPCLQWPSAGLTLPAYLVNTPTAAFWETGLRLVLLSPWLAALWMNCFSALQLLISGFDLLHIRQTNLVITQHRTGKRGATFLWAGTNLLQHSSGSRPALPLPRRVFFKKTF